jgi:glucosamine--fructose-6-phosphate aminotransferase (isomerizing)
MCGIVGYVGEREALPIIIKGLKRLEYRGYDSAGVAINNGDTTNLYKTAGKVSDLEEHIGDSDKTGGIGIGHTRWATHGLPTDENAHPHQSMDGRISMIHNGIIENYDSIKKELISNGHVFKSETDTEVLVHLIEEVQKNTGTSLFEATRLALSRVEGAYAIALFDINNPNQVVAARKGSPLVIGVGEGEFFIASDASPIIEFTKDVVYLDDEEIAELNKGEELKIVNINNETINPYIQTLELKLEAIEKGGYEHFMLKEIYEQPRSIYDSLRGRLLSQEGKIKMGGIEEYEDAFVNARRIIFIACGTSWHAGLVAEYLIEDLARIPVEVEYASEFRYRDPIIYEDDIVIAISQSGETADTLAALEMAKSKGATIFGICNVAGSSISRITDAGAYTHAGPEIGVASTKAFTTQVSILTLIAINLAKKKGKISESEYRTLLYDLEAVPKLVQKTLELNDSIEEISAIYKDVSNALYLGRGNCFPVALEGALKLKEISYIHAEGYPAAEMKHGPIALIDENMPVVVIATKDNSYEKVVSNIQEVKARKGKVIAVLTEGDTTVSEFTDHVIEIPECNKYLTPILASVPLQLLSYHIAVMRGCNVDQPRNLAKSVTVE